MVDSIQPEPRLICIPIRPILIIVSIFAIIGSSISFFSRSDQLTVSASICSVAFYSFMLFGIAKLDVFALNFSLKVIIFIISLHFLVFLVVPIGLASCVASGFIEDPKIDLSPSENFVGSVRVLFRNESSSNEKKNQFFIGIVAGLGMEMWIGLSGAAMYLKYVMLERLHKYAIYKSQPQRIDSLI